MKQNNLQKRPKKKGQLQFSHGIASVLSTFNNTIVTITDPAGKVIAWSSAGKVNFSGSRKSSAFAATVAAQDAGKQAMDLGLTEIDIYIKGAGAGRESAVRGLQASGLIINSIGDVTPVPHNGCRARKRRRV